MEATKDEFYNIVIHLVGLIANVLCVYWIVCNRPIFYTNKYLFLLIYLIVQCLTFTGSIVYHSLNKTEYFLLFRILDKGFIYVLIGATLAPFLKTSGLDTFWYSTTLGVLATCCLLTCVLVSRGFDTLSFAPYIGAGVFSLFLCLKILPYISSQLSIKYLFYGGIIYCLGVGSYLLKNFKYHHEVWHVLASIGSFILLYAIMLL